MARREAHAANATGVPSSSPGSFRLYRRNYRRCRPAPTKPPTLEGVESIARRICGGEGIGRQLRYNPFRVDARCGDGSQGSPRRATLGWLIQSRWDCSWTGPCGPPQFRSGLCRWLTLWNGAARREAHAVNANGVPSSSPGLFRSNETTLGPSHPTKPPTLKGLHRLRAARHRDPIMHKFSYEDAL